MTFESVAARGGWPGIYRWCLSTRQFHGRKGLEDNFLFLNHDILIIQIDADVAKSNYSAGHITDTVNDLPCSLPCPPVIDTVQALERVILRWLSTPDFPTNVVLCIPAQNLETWLWVGLYPPREATNIDMIECRDGLEKQLASKPMPKRLINGNSKNVAMYKKYALEFAETWPRIIDVCTQALRFDQSLLAIVHCVKS